MEMLSAVGRSLGLAEHEVGGVRMYGPGDLEIHEGLDGRYYCLDLARLFPPESPLAQCKSYREYEAVEMKRDNGAALREKRRRGVFYHLLRPELLQLPDILNPLSSDAFSGWGRRDSRYRTFNAQVSTATNTLYTVVIPRVARELEVSLTSPVSGIGTSIGLSDEGAGAGSLTSIGEILHRGGVNLRHLGAVREEMAHPLARLLVLTEMAVRATKSYIRGVLREGAKQGAAMAQEQRHFALMNMLLNVLFGSAGVRAITFWGSTLPQLLRNKYRVEDLWKEGVDTHFPVQPPSLPDWSTCICIPLFLPRLIHLFNITLRDTSFLPPIPNVHKLMADLRSEPIIPEVIMQPKQGVLRSPIHTLQSFDLRHIDASIKKLSYVSRMAGKAALQSALHHYKTVALSLAENSLRISASFLLSSLARVYTDSNSHYYLAQVAFQFYCAGKVRRESVHAVVLERAVHHLMIARKRNSQRTDVLLLLCRCKSALLFLSSKQNMYPDPKDLLESLQEDMNNLVAITLQMSHRNDDSSENTSKIKARMEKANSATESVKGKRRKENVLGHSVYTGELSATSPTELLEGLFASIISAHASEEYTMECVQNLPILRAFTLCPSVNVSKVVLSKALCILASYWVASSTSQTLPGLTLLYPSPYWNEQRPLKERCSDNSMKEDSASAAALTASLSISSSVQPPSSPSLPTTSASPSASIQRKDVPSSVGTAPTEQLLGPLNPATSGIHALPLLRQAIYLWPKSSEFFLQHLPSRAIPTLLELPLGEWTTDGIAEFRILDETHHSDRKQLGIEASAEEKKKCGDDEALKSCGGWVETDLVLNKVMSKALRNPLELAIQNNNKLNMVLKTPLAICLAALILGRPHSTSFSSPSSDALTTVPITLSSAPSSFSQRKCLGNVLLRPDTNPSCTSSDTALSDITAPAWNRDRNCNHSLLLPGLLRFEPVNNQKICRKCFPLGFFLDQVGWRVQRVQFNRDCVVPIDLDVLSRQCVHLVELHLIDTSSIKLEHVAASLGSMSSLQRIVLSSFAIDNSHLYHLLRDLSTQLEHISLQKTRYRNTNLSIFLSTYRSIHSSIH